MNCGLFCPKKLILGPGTGTGITNTGWGRLHTYISYLSSKHSGTQRHNLKLELEHITVSLPYNPRMLMAIGVLMCTG